MAADITSIFLDAVQAIFGGIASGITDLFGTLIYAEISRTAGPDTIIDTADDIVTYGLTDLATWMIVFMGVSFSLTIFYALFRKVA